MKLINNISHQLIRKGYCLIENKLLSPKIFLEKIVGSFGFPMNTIYGNYWTVTQDSNFNDTAYTNAPLKPHTDGTYMYLPPNLQIFCCEENATDGGETLLIDSNKINLPSGIKEKLSSNKYLWKSQDFDLECHAPVFSNIYGKSIFRYNEYDLKSFSMKQTI